MSADHLTGHVAPMLFSSAVRAITRHLTEIGYDQDAAYDMIEYMIKSHRQD